MLLYVVCTVFILFDIITGLVKAGYKGEICSTQLRKGLFHKLSEALAICGSGLLDYGAEYVGLNFDFSVLALVSCYICLMELISVIENLSEVSPTLAKLFKPLLGKLKEKSDEYVK